MVKEISSSVVIQITPKVYLVELFINFCFDVSNRSPKTKIKVNGIPTPKSKSKENAHSGRSVFMVKNIISCGISMELINPKIATLKSNPISMMVEKRIIKNPMILLAMLTKSRINFSSISENFMDFFFKSSPTFE